VKTVPARRGKLQFGELLRDAQVDRVLVLRHGKPVAVVIGVAGQELDAVLLEHDPGYRRTRRTRRAQAEGG
jgi:prevent-host-death family protein